MDEQKFDDDDDKIKKIEFIDDFLSKKCLEIYGIKYLIKLHEINNGSLSLIFHNNLMMVLFDLIIEPIINHCKKILSNKEMEACKYILIPCWRFFK